MLPQDLRASVATVALQSAIGAASANELFILTSTSLVERTAVCGNQVCEPGERVPTGSGIGRLLAPPFSHLSDQARPHMCSRKLVGL